MLKVIGRILVVLLVIALVGGAIYALVQNTSLGSSIRGGDFGRRASTVPAPSFGQNPSPNRFGERGEGRFSFSLGRGLTGVLGNGFVIALITVLVVLVRKFKAPRLLHVRPVSLDQP